MQSQRQAPAEDAARRVRNARALAEGIEGRVWSGVSWRKRIGVALYALGFTFGAFMPLNIYPGGWFWVPFAFGCVLAGVGLSRSGRDARSTEEEVSGNARLDSDFSSGDLSGGDHSGGDGH